MSAQDIASYLWLVAWEDTDHEYLCMQNSTVPLNCCIVITVIWMIISYNVNQKLVRAAADCQCAIIKCYYKRF